jgi:hypothetical protein
MSSEKSEVALETSEAKKRKIDVEEDESKKVYFLLFHDASISELISLENFSLTKFGRRPTKV